MYIPATNTSCTLPPLAQGRYEHSQDGELGMELGNRQCVSLHVHYASSIAHNAMKWNNYHANLIGDI